MVISRRSGDKHYYYAGKSQCSAAWCKELGIHPSTLHRRLKKGMTFEEAINVTLNNPHSSPRKRANTRTRTIWRDIIHRCYKPSHPFYEYYSSRNITVCESWQTFPSFLADMGPAPVGCHLRRRNRKVGYNKNNCYWKFSRQGIEINGETRGLSAWCRLYDMPPSGVRGRINRGMAPEQALTTPIRGRLSPYARFVFFLRRFSDDELNEELDRRKAVRAEGRCPFCMRRNHLCEAHKCHTVTALEQVAAAGGYQKNKYANMAPKRPAVTCEITLKDPK